MPLLTMLYTRKGTEDGITVKEYREGNTYMLSASLARAFLAAGFAVASKKMSLSKAMPYRANSFSRRKMLSSCKKLSRPKVLRIKRKLLKENISI